MFQRTKLGIQLSTLALAAVPASAQTARQVPNNINSNPGGGFGATVLGLTDYDGDGENEYAVAAPLEGTGNINYGRVLIYDGASGTDIQDLFGDSSTDEFGSSICAISEIDNDPIPELIVGTPGRVGPGGTPDWGGFRLILSGNPNASIPFESIGGDRMGLGAVTLDDDLTGPSPLGIFAVAGKSSVEVWQHDPATFLPLPLIPLPSIDGSTLCSAGTIAQVPSFAVKTRLDVVLVVGMEGQPFATIQGPLGSDYGASMALLREPGLDDVLVIGAPNANGGDGRVDFVDPATGQVLTTAIGPPGSGDRFGLVVATGGDVDGDGMNDVVILDQNGTEIEVYSRLGNRTGTPISIVGESGPVEGIALDITSVAGGGPQDGFADVLLGAIPATTQTPNESHVYFGGPDANVLDFGPGCKPDNTPAPVLSISSPGIVGTSGQLSMTGGTNSVALLAAGDFFPVGVPIPGGCLAHVLPIVSITLPIVGGSFGTPPAPIQFDVANLGTEIAFQSANIFQLTPQTTFETTNTLVVTVGW